MLVPLPLPARISQDSVINALGYTESLSSQVMSPGSAVSAGCRVVLGKWWWGGSRAAGAGNTQTPIASGCQHRLQCPLCNTGVFNAKQRMLFDKKKIKKCINRSISWKVSLGLASPFWSLSINIEDIHHLLAIQCFLRQPGHVTSFILMQYKH